MAASKTKIRVINHEDGPVTITTGGGATSQEFDVKNGVIETDNAADTDLVLRSFSGSLVESEKPAEKAGAATPTG